MNDDGKKTLRCSFCGKHEQQVRRMIQGPGVRICDECVRLCMSILDDGFDDLDGIQVEVGREKTVIPRITPSQVAVLALAERLIRGCVTPVTARDVVEDWLLT